MKEMTCLVTGASSGLGYAMAAGLAETGATVIMICRDKKRGKQARIRLIAQTRNPNIDLLLCDLSDLVQVRRTAREIRSFYQRLDVICNLAGIRYPSRKLTSDGYELNLATNVLGPFMLTELLLDMLLKSSPGTILNVSEDSYRTCRIRFDNIHLTRRFTMSEAVGQAAMARIVWTYELSRRLKGTGVTANAFCPAWTRSEIGRYFPAFFRWPYQLATRFFAAPAEVTMKPVIDFVLRKGLQGVSGKYLLKDKLAKTVPITYQHSLGRRLWIELESMTGLRRPVNPSEEYLFRRSVLGG